MLLKENIINVTKINHRIFKNNNRIKENHA